jgi:hypothetical protein
LLLFVQGQKSDMTQAQIQQLSLSRREKPLDRYRSIGRRCRSKKNRLHRLLRGGKHHFLHLRLL